MIIGLNIGFSSERKLVPFGIALERAESISSILSLDGDGGLALDSTDAAAGQGGWGPVSPGVGLLEGLTRVVHVVMSGQLVCWMKGERKSVVGVCHCCGGGSVSHHPMLSRVQSKKITLRRPWRTGV